MIGYAVVLAAGYVMGTKAGRRRYEQIVGTYKAVTGSPAAKTMIDAGRRKIANRRLARHGHGHADRNRREHLGARAGGPAGLTLRS